MGDKEDEFRQERLLRGVSKIPISRTCNVIVGMDLVDDGDDATGPPHTHTYNIPFPGIPRLLLLGREEKGGWICGESG